MVATIVWAARKLKVSDARDGSERVSGHSLRATGAQGLIRYGWRADAVQLMGRWESEAVRLYTREAALHAPTELTALMAYLCGVPRAEVPLPPDPCPEPAAPPPDRWILNPSSDTYHLASGAKGRARCGWDFARGGGIRGPQPPPWYWTTCGGCAPARRKRLKAQAEAEALRAKADSGAD